MAMTSVWMLTPDHMQKFLHFFGSTNTISCFGKRFRKSLQYNFIVGCCSNSLTKYTVTVPPSACPAICKSAGTCPHAVWSRHQWV